MWRLPRDGTVGRKFDPERFGQDPQFWWSPERRWPQFGVKTPCPNHGFAHCQHVKLYGWRQRKVKGVDRDFNLCYQRVHCTECEAEHKRQKKMIEACETHDPQSPALEGMRKNLSELSYFSTTIDPRVIKCAPSPHLRHRHAYTSLFSHISHAVLSSIAGTGSRSTPGSRSCTPPSPSTARPSRSSSSTSARLGRS